MCTQRELVWSVFFHDKAQRLGFDRTITSCSDSHKRCSEQWQIHTMEIVLAWLFAISKNSGFYDHQLHTNLILIQINSDLNIRHSLGCKFSCQGNVICSIVLYVHSIKHDRIWVVFKFAVEIQLHSTFEGTPL